MSHLRAAPSSTQRPRAVSRMKSDPCQTVGSPLRSAVATILCSVRRTLFLRAPIMDGLPIFSEILLSVRKKIVYRFIADEELFQVLGWRIGIRARESQAGLVDFFGQPASFG